MKRIQKILAALLLMVVSRGFAQWSPLPLPTDQVAQQLHFLTDDLGYVRFFDGQSGTNSLAKTTDGGATWVPKNLPLPNAEFQAMHFYADGAGVAVLRVLQIPSNNPTKIYHTTDDGLSWQDITPDTTATGSGNASCQFLDQNAGYFATDQYLYSTTNGGANWTTTPMAGYPMAMDFLDANHGTIGVWDGTFNYFGGMSTTTDGGATWMPTALPVNGSSIGHVRQLTTNIAMAAPGGFGAYQQSQYYWTTNSGASWDTVQVPAIPDGNLAAIDFRDVLHGEIAIASFTAVHMYATSDGGNSWVFRDSLPYFSPSDLVLTPNFGYLGGPMNTLYKLDLTNAVVAPQPSELTLFPNPAKSGQRLSWESNARFSALTISDMTGKRIHVAQLDQPSFELPDLVPGVYVIELSGPEDSHRARLLVQ